MALEATVKYGIQRIAQAFRDYAAAHGWSDDEYRVLVHLKMEWNSIHVLLVARSFPGGNTDQAWFSVWAFLQKKLKDEPDLLECISLVIHTFDQVAEGGLYAIGPEYVEINDLLTSGPIEQSSAPSIFRSKE